MPHRWVQIVRGDGAMTSNYIRAVKQTRSWTAQARDDAYEFRKDRPHHWLQRLCFRVLDWIGAHRVDMLETVTYGPFNSPNIVAAIADVLKDRFSVDGLSRKEYVILMGRDKWMELLGNKEVMHTLKFDVPMTWRDHYQTTVFGVPVVVVPYVEGFCVVPIKDILR